MSDSDSDQKHNNTEHTIKPAKGGASIDTSTWPLLLKVRADIPIQTFSI
jgi:hypothetical protein